MTFLSKVRSFLPGKREEDVHPLEREGLLKLDSYGSVTEGDRKVLEQLLQHGADLSKPRHVVHYLYFAQPDDRERAFQELEEQGYEVHSGATLPELEQPYSLLAERVGVVDDGKIGSERHLLSELATRLGGVYDGWEAALD